MRIKLGMTCVEKATGRLFKVVDIILEASDKGLQRCDVLLESEVKGVAWAGTPAEAAAEFDTFAKYPIDPLPNIWTTAHDR